MGTRERRDRDHYIACDRMGSPQRLEVNRVSNRQLPKGETDTAMAPQGPEARQGRLQTRRTTPSRQESSAGVQQRIPVKQRGVQVNEKGNHCI